MIRYSHVVQDVMIKVYYCIDRQHIDGLNRVYLLDDVLEEIILEFKDSWSQLIGMEDKENVNEFFLDSEFLR